MLKLTVLSYLNVIKTLNKSSYNIDHQTGTKKYPDIVDSE